MASLALDCKESPDNIVAFALYEAAKVQDMMEKLAHKRRFRAEETFNGHTELGDQNVAKHVL